MQDDLKDECQIVYFPENKDWAKESIILKPMIRSYESWKTIFSTALDDLAELVSPKKIIYCEGRDHPSPTGKEKGTDAKVYNNIFSKEYPDTLFVSSGGNTELDQRSEIAILILSKVFNTLEILVFKDRDVSPSLKTSLKDREDYLLKHSSHRMTKRFELENYLYDEEVLSKFCENNNYLFDAQGYASLIKDIKEQDVKELNGQIKGLCKGLGNINKETFKIELSKIITSNMAVYNELKKVVFN